MALYFSCIFHLCDVFNRSGRWGLLSHFSSWSVLPLFGLKQQTSTSPLRLIDRQQPLYMDIVALLKIFNLIWLPMERTCEHVCFLRYRVQPWPHHSIYLGPCGNAKARPGIADGRFHVFGQHGWSWLGWCHPCWWLLRLLWLWLLLLLMMMMMIMLMIVMMITPSVRKFPLNS